MALDQEERVERLSDRPRIRLLLSDVDGTLLTKDKVLTKATLAAVEELRSAGIRFSLTSGRPPRGVRMLVEPLRLEEPLAGCGGAVYVQPDLALIESYKLGSSLAFEADRLLRDQGLDVWIYTATEWLVGDRTAPRVAYEEQAVGFTARAVERFRERDFADAVKILGVSNEPDRVAACEKDVRKRLAGRASVARSHLNYLDVTHLNANKGTAVTILGRLMRVEPREIATIGDMPNDVLMFHKSGFSIAMGNASDAVKAEASIVTGTNEDDGFAQAVRQFLLNGVSA